MSPTAWIAFWAIAFVVSHLVISSSAVRPRLIAAVGEQPYRGIYSIVAFGTLGPLIYEFATNKHAGPLLWYFRDSTAMRAITWILMFITLILFVASFINPNPGGLGASSTDVEPRGILKITRHPGFAAFALFGLAHLPMNGWAGDVFFFGMFPVISIVGGIHQDRRKLREIGAAAMCRGLRSESDWHSVSQSFFCIRLYSAAIRWAKDFPKSRPSGKDGRR
jgi:uncharacterized membrane protein